MEVEEHTARCELNIKERWGAIGAWILEGSVGDLDLAYDTAWRQADEHNWDEIFGTGDDEASGGAGSRSSWPQFSPVQPGSQTHGDPKPFSEHGGGLPAGLAVAAATPSSHSIAGRRRAEPAGDAYASASSWGFYSCLCMAHRIRRAG